MFCHSRIYLALTPSFFALGFLFSPAIPSTNYLAFRIFLLHFYPKNLTLSNRTPHFSLWPLALFIVTSHFRRSLQHFTHVSLPICHVMQPTQTRHVSYLSAVIGHSLETNTLSPWEAKLFNRLTFLSSLEATDIYSLSASGQVIMKRHFLSSFLRHRHFFSHYYAKCLTLGANACLFLGNLFLLRRLPPRDGT